MSPEFYDVIHQWGYVTIFFAIMLYGEIFLLMVGLVVVGGVLSFPYVLIASILGVIVHDNFMFSIARLTGSQILDRKKKIKRKVRRAMVLFNNYNLFIAFTIRFYYGLRTILLIVMGLSKIKRFTFILCDAVSSIVWSFIYLALGYYFSSIILYALSPVHIIKHIKAHEGFYFVLLASTAIFIYIIIRLVTIIKEKSNKDLDINE